MVERLDKIGPLGTRPHQAHVAFDDIEELRKFIEVRAAKEAAEAREARIAIGRCPHRTAQFGIDVHGAELVNLERLAKPSHALLGINHRPLRFQLHRQRDEGHDRADKEHANTR